LSNKYVKRREESLIIMLIKLKNVMKTSGLFIITFATMHVKLVSDFRFENELKFNQFE